MEIKTSSNNVTKKHLINARSSQSFVNWQNPEKIIAAALVEDVDSKTGAAAEYAYIWTENNTYAGNALAIREIVNDLVELLNEADELTGVCNVRKTKGGQDFVTLELVD